MTRNDEKGQLLNPQETQEIAQSTAHHQLDGDEQKDDEKEESMDLPLNTPKQNVPNKIVSSLVNTMVTDLRPVEGDSDALEVEQEMSNMLPKLKNIHRICYCQRELIEADDMDADEGWNCHSCSRWINESVNFWCDGGEECIYKNIYGSPYLVCSECFNMETQRDSDQKEKEQVHEDSIQSTLIIDKVGASLMRIS